MTHPWRMTGTLLASLVLTVLVGCAGPAPHYAPSIDNVEMLKKSGMDPIKTGTVSVAPELKTGQSISIRANTMVSGVGNHYGDYLASALRQELELAKLYNAQSDTEVSGTLLRNDISAGGFSTNSGEIAARFVVKRGNQVRFDKVLQVQHEWEGSFAGAVAIPRAANNYPVMVQKLIGRLLADADFHVAVRK
ncbi:MAG: hypothetical protein R3E92_02030 [Burkholderiaceae bacterium]|nr:hypothetical protein [Rhodoferax sp.]MCB2029984.1 hypothetical protein [Rhodoferax sp.]MCP5261973.1 hypothetical protein [Rhodoferax sp.]